ncbi:MAG: XTP/dITP diphosphatase [Desulfurococcales archaeon]|nr:XTP/dITP diphosphatase [Desulfurococcales archaeon]
MSGACKLYLVTGNRHKLEEANDILKSYGVRLEQAPVREKLEIQTNSLEEIAIYAARHAYKLMRVPLVVDDSGLFVDALNGFPGPYSSYVYKKIGYWGLLRLLEGMGNRRACFKTVATLILPPIEKIFTGEACGVITWEARGSHGFGFDPIFIPDGYEKTYAEMSPEEKNRVSHRFKAFSKLGEWIARYQVKC